MPVPEHLRATVRAELDALVRGDRPDHMTWVRQYGTDGATLIAQPEVIWDHAWSEAYRSDLGGWFVEVPLWTVQESPSDLFAQIYVDPSGNASVYDVHVL